jgi:hypothetical protein
VSKSANDPRRRANSRSYKVNANNQLSLAPSCALHFRRTSAGGILLGHVLDPRLWAELLMAIGATIPWRLRRA